MNTKKAGKKHVSSCDSNSMKAPSKSGQEAPKLDPER